MHCRLHEIERSVCVDQFVYETYIFDLRPQANVLENATSTKYNWSFC